MNNDNDSKFEQHDQIVKLASLFQSAEKGYKFTFVRFFYYYHQTCKPFHAF